MPEIMIEQTEACFGQPYEITVDCPPGAIVEWSVPITPTGVNPDDVVFLNPGAAQNYVTLPLFVGTYGIRAVCRIPV